VDHFRQHDGQTYCENVPLSAIAERVGTPCYVYSQATLARHCKVLVEAFASYPTTLCYAVKANSNLTVLKEIFASGFGADVVSAGELERALLAGAAPEKIVFSGVGKQAHEIRKGIKAGIRSFNVESRDELALIEATAKEMKNVARISLRINPNIDARTNPAITTGLYSTKFGLAEDEAREIILSLRERPSLELVGIACHIGSQIVDLEPLQSAARRMASFAAEARAMGFPLRYLNAGGGLGIRYKNEVPPPVEAYAAALIQEIAQTGLELVVEPGRVLVGNIGVLLTRVLSVKKTPVKTFFIVDAAMNDLLRPSIYGSYHEILPVSTANGEECVLADIVGPICETGDFLGKDRTLPLARIGDLMFVRGCGAYSSSMASNYNSRPRAPEVLVSGDSTQIIRRRESLESLWAHELEPAPMPAKGRS